MGGPPHSKVVGKKHTAMIQNTSWVEEFNNYKSVASREKGKGATVCVKILMKRFLKQQKSMQWIDWGYTVMDRQSYFKYCPWQFEINNSFELTSTCELKKYSRVPIRSGVRNIRYGSPLASCIVPNKRHGCLGLCNRRRFIHTNLYLKVLPFDMLIQL